jgi:hypothetical protein
MAFIEGMHVREVYCKNDDCRKFLGYERIEVGIAIYVCPRVGCKNKSLFKMGYSKGKEMMNRLQSLKEKNEELKGGE